VMSIVMDTGSEWVKYYVLTLKNKYNILVLMMYCKTLFAAIEV